MFGIGFLEILVIAVVALIFVGPQKLPGVARQMGRFFVQMRRMTTDVRSTIDTVVRDAEADIVKEERDKVRKLLTENLDHAAEPAPKDDSLENPLGAEARSTPHREP